MNPFNQIDYRPYTIWNLTRNGWTIIRSFNDGYKTIQTVQIKEESRKKIINLISSK